MLNVNNKIEIGPGYMVSERKDKVRISGSNRGKDKVMICRSREEMGVRVCWWG